MHIISKKTSDRDLYFYYSHHLSNSNGSRHPSEVKRIKMVTEMEQDDGATLLDTQALSKLRTVALKLFADKLLTSRDITEINANDGFLFIPKNYLPHAKVTRDHAVSMLGVGGQDESVIGKEIKKIEIVRKIVIHEATEQVKTVMREEAARKGCRVKNFGKTSEYDTRVVEVFSDLKEM